MKKLAILGPGVVGGSCAEILLRDADLLERNAGEQLELSYVLARRALPDRPYKDKVVTDFSVIEHDADVFLVIETIGGCGAALEYVRRALAAGKHVVTANKQLIAEHGAELLALAKANGVSLLFEASVGGGIPVLHPLSQCLGANEIYEVRGILNGTTNFILTQMLEHGQSYEAALRDAQARGYAEQDPTADVEGIDAGRKVCILADMMFGKNVDPSRVRMTGISAITAEDAAFAEAAGMKLRLLGRAIRQGQALAVFVSPHFIAGTQPLAPVSGVLNASRCWAAASAQFCSPAPAQAARRRPAPFWQTSLTSSAIPAAASPSAGRQNPPRSVTRRNSNPRSSSAQDFPKKPASRRSAPSAGCPTQARFTAALRRKPPEGRCAPPASRWTQSGPCWHKNVLNPLSPVIHLWQGGFFMKRKWWTVCFLSILAGSALHFLYDLWPNPLTAVFAPVNESVWEHLKLLYWPFLAAAFVLTKDEADGRKSWCGLLAGLLGAPLLLLGAYYTLLSGFTLHGLPLDLILYALAMAGGFALAWHLQRARLPAWLCGVLVIAAGIYGAALALFSFAPPELPIFLPPV